MDRYISPEEKLYNENQKKLFEKEEAESRERYSTWVKENQVLKVDIEKRKRRARRKYERMSLKKEIKLDEEYSFDTTKKKAIYKERLEKIRRRAYFKNFGTEDGYDEWYEKHKEEVKNKIEDRNRKWREVRKLKSEEYKLRGRYREYITINGIKLQKKLPINVLEIIYNNLKISYLHEKVEVEVYNYD